MIQTARKFFPLLDLVVIMLVAYAAVQAIYQGMGSRMTVTPAPAATEPDQVREAAPMAPLSPAATRAIVDRDLFSTLAPKADTSSPTDVQSLANTALRLRLMGTIAGGSRGAYAVIEDSARKKQDLYHVGDTVQSALVKAILRQMVVLEEGGRETRLSMEDNRKEPGSPAGESGPAGSLESGSQGTRDVRLSRDELESSLKNVNQLMTQVRVRPHFSMGRPDGLALNRILPDSIFSKMGLENGDVIQAVGEQKIKSVDDVMTLYKSLKSQENVSLQVQRQGAPTTIKYSME